MKAVIAITAAIASAATTVAYAGHKIEINESKVSAEAKAAAKDYIEKTGKVDSDNSFHALISALESIDNTMPIDVRLILAAASRDSVLAAGERNMGRTTGHAYNCYSNCHSACHGSRSWR